MITYELTQSVCSFTSSRMPSSTKDFIIFLSTYDGKIQWSTSGVENVADFCHFLT